MLGSRAHDTNLSSSSLWRLRRRQRLGIPDACNRSATGLHARGVDGLARADGARHRRGLDLRARPAVEHRRHRARAGVLQPWDRFLGDRADARDLPTGVSPDGLPSHKTRPPRSPPYRDRPPRSRDRERVPFFAEVDELKKDAEAAPHLRRSRASCPARYASRSATREGRRRAPLAPPQLRCAARRRVFSHPRLPPGRERARDVRRVEAAGFARSELSRVDCVTPPTSFPQRLRTISRRRSPRLRERGEPVVTTNRARTAVPPAYTGPTTRAPDRRRGRPVGDAPRRPGPADDGGHVRRALRGDRPEVRGDAAAAAPGDRVRSRPVRLGRRLHQRRLRQEPRRAALHHDRRRRLHRTHERQSGRTP